MRIRTKPWAKPELLACPFCIQNPTEQRGHWRSLFPKDQPLYLELGCGKGGWIAQAAMRYPEVNFISMDIKNEMLGMTKRNIEAAFAQKERSVDNVRIAIQNITGISGTFAPEDRIDRIYINFCNPWPKSQHKKRRLTHTRQLVQYKQFLQGEIWFKTDDDELFYESMDYFKEAGFVIRSQTTDLAASGFAENILTEHEKMFMAEGKTIKFLIAVPEDKA